MPKVSIMMPKISEIRHQTKLDIGHSYSMAVITPLYPILSYFYEKGDFPFYF